MVVFHLIDVPNYAIILVIKRRFSFRNSEWELHRFLLSFDAYIRLHESLVQAAKKNPICKCPCCSKKKKKIPLQERGQREKDWYSPILGRPFAFPFLYFICSLSSWPRLVWSHLTMIVKLMHVKCFSFAHLYFIYSIRSFVMSWCGLYSTLLESQIIDNWIPLKVSSLHP